MHIEIQDLSVVFATPNGPVSAVHHQSATFFQGEITGIIGETGSGKSVLGLSILRLLQSNATVTGRVQLGDRELTAMSPKEITKIRGREIALVAQNPATSLNPSVPVGKQIQEVFHLAGCTKVDSKSKTLALLQKFSFAQPETIYHAYPFELSGGMRQRILTAIAVAANPTWLIADEPTKGLDAVLRKQVYDIFRKIKQENHVSFLVITHDLLLARKLCDRIVVMYCGRILEEGPGESLFSNPKHPYTKGLIQSLPNNGLIPMEGFSPGFTDLPTGCVFHPRCPYATAQCQNEEPILRFYKDGKVACHGNFTVGTPV